MIPRDLRGLPWVLARTTVEIRGFSRQVLRVMAPPRQMPRLCPRHVAAVFSVANSVVPTMATPGNPQKLPRQFPRPSAAIATAVSADVHSKQFPRPSTAIATAIRRYAATSSEVRGSPRLLPQHVPRFCSWQTPFYQSCPRPSGPVAVSLAVGVSRDLSMNVRRRFRRQFCGCFRRRVRGCVCGRCRGCFRGRFRR